MREGTEVIGVGSLDRHVLGSPTHPRFPVPGSPGGQGTSFSPEAQSRRSEKNRTPRALGVIILGQACPRWPEPCV